MFRIPHSRSVAEAGTEAAVVVPMEVEAEAASTVAAVGGEVITVEAAERIAAEAAERIAAEAVVRTAAARRVTLLAAWVPMGAAAACTAAARVRTAATAVDDHPAPLAERVRME